MTRFDSEGGIKAFFKPAAVGTDACVVEALMGQVIGDRGGGARWRGVSLPRSSLWDLSTLVILDKLLAGAKGAFVILSVPSKWSNSIDMALSLSFWAAIWQLLLALEFECGTQQAEAEFLRRKMDSPS